MIYITGDTHGDLSRFRHPLLRRLKKHDYLIVCGDFGFLWSGDRAEQRVLKWLGRRRYSILFVEGTHDNFDLLLKYPKTPWNGGEARRISGKLMHLCRGGVFDIDGKTVFAFGGGTDEDAEWRSDSGTWWKEELPEPWEIAQARKNLEAHGNKVDYIVTHQSSWKIKTLLARGDKEMNPMDAFFNEIRDGVAFKKWFFGSFHKDKSIPPLEVSLFQYFVEMRPDCRMMGGKGRGKSKPKKAKRRKLGFRFPK